MLNIVILTNFEGGGDVVWQYMCLGHDGFWEIMGFTAVQCGTPNFCTEELFPYIPVYIFHKKNVIPGIRNANV